MSKQFIWIFAVLGVLASGSAGAQNFAIFDTTFATTVGSVDTLYFGGVAVGQVSGEVSNPGGIQLAWHQDYKPVSGYSNLAGHTVSSANQRRAGQKLVDPAKKWPVAAGLTFSYDIAISACVVTGTANGTVHVQALVRVR